MKVFNGELEILSSGTIASEDLSDTRFVVSDNPLMEIVCRVSMIEEESGISLIVLSENAIALVFKKPTSREFGPVRPAMVGHLNGRILYANFRVSMQGGNDSYNLNYTFYLGGAMQLERPALNVD